MKTRQILEEVVVEVAQVAVDDDYRVQLTQLHLDMDYAPQQARELAGLLLDAADEADGLLIQDAEERVARQCAVQPRAVTGEVIL